MKAKRIPYLAVVLAVLIPAALALGRGDPNSQSSQPAITEHQMGDISLSIKTDRTTYSPGEPVAVQIRIANTSDKEVKLTTRGVWPIMEAKALGPQGQILWGANDGVTLFGGAPELIIPPKASTVETALWPQCIREVVKPQEGTPRPEISVLFHGFVEPRQYALEADFLLSYKDKDLPSLILPIMISDKPQHPFAQKEKEGITWRVDVDKGECQPGEEVSLKFTVSNLGARPLTIWWYPQFLDSYFSISDSQGKEVWNNGPKDKSKDKSLTQMMSQMMSPLPVTFLPGQCKMVKQAHWDGTIETTDPKTGEKTKVNAPPGEYTLKIVTGFLSMPTLETLKFSLLAPKEEKTSP